MRGADSREPARNNLATFGHELRQQPYVLIVHRVDFLDTELANLLAPEIFASAFTTAAAGTSAGPRAAGLMRRRRRGWSGTLFGRCRRRSSFVGSFVSHNSPSVILIYAVAGAVSVPGSAAG